MKRQIGFALCGLAFGVTARYFFPGHPSGGYLLSAALGAVGAWLAELLGERAHLPPEGAVDAVGSAGGSTGRAILALRPNIAEFHY